MVDYLGNGRLTVTLDGVVFEVKPAQKRYHFTVSRNGVVLGKVYQRVAFGLWSANKVDWSADLTQVVTGMIA